MKISKSLLSEESLMKELGLTDFDPNHQEELFTLMMDILEIKVLDCVLSELSEEDKRQFTVILLGENTDAAKEFLDRRIKGLDKKLEQVVQAFKEELVADVLEAKKELLKKQKS